MSISMSISMPLSMSISMHISMSISISISTSISTPISISIYLKGLHYHRDDIQPPTLTLNQARIYITPTLYKEILNQHDERTSNETIVHHCALTYIPHVSRVHVV